MVKVGMADLNVAKAPDSLTTLGLGSCIGLTLYHPVGFAWHDERVYYWSPFGFQCSAGL